MNRPNQAQKPLEPWAVKAAAVLAVGAAAANVADQPKAANNPAISGDMPALIGLPNLASNLPASPKLKVKLNSEGQVTKIASAQIEPTITELPPTNNIQPEQPTPITTAQPDKKLAMKDISKPKAELGPDNKILFRVPENVPEPNGELKNLHPEYLKIPGAVSQYFHDNVVYMPSQRHSGILVRNSAGTQTGIKLDEHSVRKQFNNFESGNIGKGSVAIDYDIQAFTGDRLDQLTPVGTISQFRLNADNDTESDIAYAAFRGYKAEDVAASDQFSTPDPNEPVFLSGWSEHQQPADGIITRQELALNVLGFDEVELSGTGKKLKIYWAAAAKNSSNTTCDEGINGSGVVQAAADSSILPVGVAIGYAKFGDQSNATKKFFESKYQVDLSGYSAVCAISYLPPDTSAGAFDVNIISNEHKIDVTARENEALERFNNIDEPKYVPSGYLIIRNGKDPQSSMYLDDPALLAFEDCIVAVYRNNNEGTKPMATVLPNIDNIEIYSKTDFNDSDGPDPVEAVVGDITTGKDKSGNLAFISQDGVPFGVLLPNAPTLGKRYALALDKGGVIYAKSPGSGVG